MRAVVARRGTVGVEDVADPVPGTGQVLVAPLACGICGSDLHLVDLQAAMPDRVPAMVLGHEFVGRVVDIGPGTDPKVVGTTVTSVPYLDTATGPQLVGLSPTVTGGLAEQLVLQEHRLLAIPAGFPAEYAALAEPLAVGVHAVGAADLRDGDVALVVGCGPVGLAVIAALKAAGHGPVVAADFAPDRRRLAETMGADVVVDPQHTSPYADWAQLAGPALPPSALQEEPMRANTVVFECVGVPGVLSSVLESALPHTRVVVVGVCLQPDTIVGAIAITKEISMRFVFAYRPDEFATALRWIVERTVDVGPLVTARWDLAAVADAFAALREPREHCKILLSPGGER